MYASEVLLLMDIESSQSYEPPHHVSIPVFWSSHVVNAGEPRDPSGFKVLHRESCYPVLKGKEQPRVRISQDSDRRAPMILDLHGRMVIVCRCWALQTQAGCRSILLRPGFSYGVWVQDSAM